MTSLTTSFSPLPRPKALPAAAEPDCSAAIPVVFFGEGGTGDGVPDAVSPGPLDRTTAKTADVISLGNMGGPQRGSGDKPRRKTKASSALATIGLIHHLTYKAMHCMACLLY